MLPRTLCYSTGLLKKARGSHDLLLFSGIRRPLAAAPRPSISTARDLSTKTNGSDKESVVDKPIDSSIDGSSAPSSGEALNVTEPATKTEAKSALANYYDAVFQLWTERSGTNEILALKESVNEAGVAFDQASATVTKSRRTLETALRAWEKASGQHMQLLQRRESWTPEDAQRFADYVSLEITSRNELEQARQNLARSEEILTKSQLDYINKMRRRYHEEQIWQDQWRVLGTYGTWSLIVLNSCVFLGSQFFQRRREKDRMESIERLIRENRSETSLAQVQQQAALVDPEEKDEAPVKSEVANDSKETVVESTAETKGEVMPAATIVDETNDGASSTAMIMEEQVEPMPIIPSTKMMDVRKNGSNQEESPDPPKVDPQENSDVESARSDHEPKPLALPKLGAALAIVKRWEGTLRSKTKAWVHQTLHKALPADVAREMPASVSDIHVPSAVIGASVGGIAAVTMTMIISSLLNRK